MAEVLDHLLVEAFMMHDHGVDTIIGSRLLGSYDVGRNILTEATAGLDHRPGTYPTTLAHQYIATEDDVILHLAITGDLTAIAKDTVVANLCIVRDMHALVDEVAIANAGRPLC